MLSNESWERNYHYYRRMKNDNTHLLKSEDVFLFVSFFFNCFLNKNVMANMYEESPFDVSTIDSPYINC